MKDSNQMIHYQGFQTTADGGRRLQFSLDESKTSVAAVITISISPSFFTGPAGITFQQATSICCAKLREDLISGISHMTSEQIELTTADIAQFRDNPRVRRRS